MKLEEIESIVVEFEGKFLKFLPSYQLTKQSLGQLKDDIKPKITGNELNDLYGFYSENGDLLGMIHQLLKSRQDFFKVFHKRTGRLYMVGETIKELNLEAAKAAIDGRGKMRDELHSLFLEEVKKGRFSEEELKQRKTKVQLKFDEMIGELLHVDKNPFEELDFVEKNIETEWEKELSI